MTITSPLSRRACHSLSGFRVRETAWCSGTIVVCSRPARTIVCALLVSVMWYTGARFATRVRCTVRSTFCPTRVFPCFIGCDVLTWVNPQKVGAQPTSNRQHRSSGPACSSWEPSARSSVSVAARLSSLRAVFSRGLPADVSWT